MEANPARNRASAVHKADAVWPRARHAVLLRPRILRLKGGHMSGTLRLKRLRTRWGSIVICSGTFLLAGCSGSQDTISQSPQLGLRCVDDSAHCISQREKVFDGYMADKSRAWVKQPAEPHAYASGVRLFALSKRRKELSCDELSHGKQEADGAPVALRGPGGAGLTPAQVSRAVMLAGDVGRELSKEMSRRCGKT